MLFCRSLCSGSGVFWACAGVTIARRESRPSAAANPAEIRPLRKAHAIENALADAVRFFHIDALSSSVDFDMAPLVLASGPLSLYGSPRGYDDVQARQIFRDLLDMSADVAITPRDVTARFHRCAHL
jgi:hypothetical protein